MLIGFLLFVAFLSLLALYFNQKPDNLPPGEWGPPVIGLVPIGREGFDGILLRNKKRYDSSVYCVKIGARTSVFITDWTIMKNALSTLIMSGRPNFHTIHAFGEGLGVSMSAGLVWQTNRRFSTKALRDFGMGKSEMAPIIEYEVENVVKYYESKVGQTVTLSGVINVAVINSLWIIVSGRRYDLEDARMQKFSDMTRENFDILQSAITILDFFPRAKYIPRFIKDKYFRTGELRNNREELKAFFVEVIDEHKKTLDPDNPDPSNFIDMYLIDAIKNKDPTLNFKDNVYNLVHILINFFTGGSDTTTNNIRWLINLIVMHPEIQEKIQKELDENIPSHRLPCQDDKNNLPYFEAAMHDAMRLGSVLIYGIPHSADEETTLEGFRIPKGTVIFPCLEQCHRDPKYWKHPERFYPEHFLDANGKFNGKTDGLAPFSIGKRQCPGLAYAKVVIFLVCSSLLKKFKIRSAPGEKLTYEADKTSPFFNFPKMYNFIFEKRQ